jgi:molecular chaperone GrpE
MTTQDDDKEIQNQEQEIQVIPVTSGGETPSGEIEEVALPLNPEIEQALQDALASVGKKSPKQAKSAAKDMVAEEREGFNKRIRDLHVQLMEKTKELDAANDRVLRYHADLENYKKRAQKERADIFNYGNEDIAKAFLEALDNLERALRHSDKADSSGIIEGVTMTLRQMSQIFDKFDVKPIKAVGEKFDPNYHQAISQVYREDIEPGIVVEEHQRGFMLKDRLLRPSMVVVSTRQPVS